mgnify:FL=1|tara:strand:+ start:157 stop:426 length:270 start_codon:yes stop_codon:yes gene_type:complete
MNKVSEGLRTSVIRNILKEGGESPSFGTDPGDPTTTFAGIVDSAGGIKGGIAGMAGDTSPKSFASLMYDRRFQSILPFWYELLLKDMNK